jgi:hypothetical protein
MLSFPLPDPLLRKDYEKYDRLSTRRRACFQVLFRGFKLGVRQPVESEVQTLIEETEERVGAKLAGFEVGRVALFDPWNMQEQKVEEGYDINKRRGGEAM